MHPLRIQTSEAEATKMNVERLQALNDEIDRLLKVNFIPKTLYPDWLTNAVLLKKNGKWRVCVDFTDLSRVCPKDSFLLPSINQIIDTTTGHELLSFMDAYSGYNQIKMHPTDEDKTAFTTVCAIYYYKIMPFGKNAEATFQRMVNKVFKVLIGNTMEVYVDDMLVKSLDPSNHIKHLEEAFSLLRKFNVKLNTEKCTFKVAFGKFLGYLVT